jgi:hypothetical protein
MSSTKDINVSKPKSKIFSIGFETQMLSITIALGGL